MRRLPRHLFTLCSAAWLLLCVAACVLWVRSDRVADSLFWQNYTQEPLTAEATAYANARGRPAKFVSRLSRWGAGVSSGLLVFTRVLVLDPDDAWSPEFQKAYVNRPQWYHNATRSDPDEVPRDGILGRLGFVSETKPYPSEFVAVVRRVALPLWGVAIASTIPPSTWTLHRLRAHDRRRRSGLCAKCGYDLRASPQRCPECGAAAVGGRSVSDGPFDGSADDRDAGPPYRLVAAGGGSGGAPWGVGGRR